MASPSPNVDPSKIPFARNPNGDPPNFLDPPTLAPAVFIVGLTLTIISGSLVILRLVTNFKTVGKWGLDDCLCLFAEVAIIGYWAIVNSLSDSARHTWDVPISVVDPSYLKRSVAMNMIIGPGMWASKAAILALYIRLFGTRNWLRRTCYGLLVFTFLFYWSNVAITLKFCIPSSGGPWDAAVLKKCASTGPAVVINGVFGVVADLVLFALPFPIIFGLHLGRKNKIGLTVVFSIGVLAVVASVASLAYRIKVFLGNDPLWNGSKVTIVTFAEVFGTVIVSCAPALSSFWRNIFTQSKLFTSLRSGLLSRIARSMPQSTRRDGEVIEASQDGIHLNRSSSHLKHSHNYSSVEDGGFHSDGPHAKSYSTVSTSPPVTGVIIRSTTIDQFLD